MAKSQFAVLFADRFQAARASTEIFNRTPIHENPDRPDKTVERASLGPVGRSAAELRFFPFATVFWLIP